MFEHVINFGNSKLSQHYQLLEGAEKFLKSTEMIGKYLLDQKDFQHYCESQFSRMDNELINRVLKVEFITSQDEYFNKLNNETKTSINTIEDRLHKLEQNFNKQMFDFKTKQVDIEQNTLWKIRDYEQLLGTRISETLMKDYVAEELGKVSHQNQKMVDIKGIEIEKLITVVTSDQDNLKHSFDDKVEDLRKNLELSAKA